MQYRKVGFQAAVIFLESVRGEVGRRTAPEKAEPLPTSSGPLENLPFKGQYEKFYVPSEWLAKRHILTRVLERFEVAHDNPKRQSD